MNTDPTTADQATPDQTVTHLRPVFDLPPQHPAATDPSLTDRDRTHIALIMDCLQQSVATLDRRLADLRRITTGEWQQASDRDLEIRDVTARLGVLRRHDRDICLGRYVRSDGEIVYIGRVGLIDTHGRQLLVDWRTADAEPFFAATHAHPTGVQSRRRYRWSRGCIVDFSDELLTTGSITEPIVPDDDSMFLANLNAGRTPRMRDVLGTIAADQDLAIRSDSHGALVVDGGPGTGKTVVALHRAAYLLFADARLRGHRGGVLVVGPHEPYLGYVSDVLPSLGTEGVQMCTPRDMVAMTSPVIEESDDTVARLKGSLTLVDALERAVAFYEDPPGAPIEVATPWGEATISVANWAESFDAATGFPHNEAREEIWATLVDIVRDALGRVVASTPDDDLRAALAADDDLVAMLHRAWPMLDAEDIVGDLWTVPAFLRWCAPSLTADEVRVVQRDEPTRWTTADLPLLDAARRRLGDRSAAGRAAQRTTALAAQRAQMDTVVADLIDSHEFDDGEGLMTMLRRSDLRDVLVDESAAPRGDADALAGPFAHIVVDEAQELTDAQWRMLLSRCPSRSMTVVGDRAQARRGFAETWAQRLHRVGFDDIRIAPLTVNYRTPAQIMAAAEPVIRAAIPDANVPTSIRDVPGSVVHAAIDDAPVNAVESVVSDWLARHEDGIACVIGDPDFPEHPRVRSLTPESAKGLEFDLVVLVRPEDMGTGITGAVDTYVAMTRATARLVIVG